MYAVFDTETTGFSPATGDRILEIAVVLLDADLRVTEEWDTLVNPGPNAWSPGVHGITRQQAASAPLFSEVVGDVADLLSGRTVVAHNLPFDRRFVNAEFTAAGRGEPIRKGEGICTMQLTRKHFPGRRYGLADACGYAGVRLDNAHCALDDTRATVKLLRYFRGPASVPAAASRRGRHSR